MSRGRMDSTVSFLSAAYHSLHRIHTYIDNQQTRATDGRCERSTDARQLHHHHRPAVHLISSTMPSSPSKQSLQPRPAIPSHPISISVPGPTRDASRRDRLAHLAIPSHAAFHPLLLPQRMSIPCFRLRVSNGWVFTPSSLCRARP